MTTAETKLINLEFKGKPFTEAIEYLRQKANLSTKHWWELIGEAHNQSFVVAGAAKNELIEDFHQAINKAIGEGTTLDEFRKDFDNAVAKHGWSYNGSRYWRSRLIYNVNVRNAYQAGRYAKLNSLAESDAAPYWEYRDKGDVRVRPQHHSWNGIILRADDSWWDTHYPPNGWL